MHVFKSHLKIGFSRIFKDVQATEDPHDSNFARVQTRLAVLDWQELVVGGWSSYPLLSLSFPPFPAMKRPPEIQRGCMGDHCKLPCGFGCIALTPDAFCAFWVRKSLLLVTVHYNVLKKCLICSCCFLQHYYIPYFKLCLFVKKEQPTDLGFCVLAHRELNPLSGSGSDICNLQCTGCMLHNVKIHSFIIRLFINKWKWWTLRRYSTYRVSVQCISGYSSTLVLRRWSPVS